MQKANPVARGWGAGLTPPISLSASALTTVPPRRPGALIIPFSLLYIFAVKKPNNNAIYVLS